MSQYVEILRGAYAAFAEGGLEATMAFFHPEIVWEDLDVLPGADRYIGHDALRESVGQFYEAWDDLSFTAEEFVDTGDAVIVAHRWRGTGKASGAPIDTVVWNVFSFRDGKIVGRKAFQDRARAVEAAGGPSAEVDDAHRQQQDEGDHEGEQ